MQLSLTFPDLGYPDVLFIATNDSLAEDALEAAAEEWLVDPLFLEISYLGDYVPRLSRLLSKGVVADSQLTVSLLRWIGKELLTDASTREKVGELIKKGSFGSDRILRLDTPTFTDDDGCLDFKKEWIPNEVYKICFANPDPVITSTASNFLEGSDVIYIDLLGLQYVTSVSDGFLIHCWALKEVNLNCLQNVSRIGSHFLCGCCALEHVDFSSFEKVSKMGSWFFDECVSLKTITNITGLRNVKQLEYLLVDYTFSTVGCCSHVAPFDAALPEYELLSEEMKKVLEKQKELLEG